MPVVMKENSARESGRDLDRRRTVIDDGLAELIATTAVVLDSSKRG
jgi:hypothetical protein